MRYHITITIRIFVSRPVTIRPCPKTAGTTPTSVSLTWVGQFHRIAITVHLNPSAGVVSRNRSSLYSRGQPKIIFSPCRFRTAHKEGPFSLRGAVEPYIWHGWKALFPQPPVPPPASSGEERHMADSRLSSRPLAFNLIAQCLFCFPSAFGAERRH